MTIATDFEYGVNIAYIDYYPQCKTRSQGSKTRSRGYILNFRNDASFYCIMRDIKAAGR